MPVVFERFTDRARRVVVLAQDEARLLNHDFIGTEHLLLGMLREGRRQLGAALWRRPMQRALFVAIGGLALLIACTDSNTHGASTTTSLTVPVATPTSTPTIPPAPTDCRQAPEMPACRPGHGTDTSG